jgi:restriction system protein
MFIPTKNVILDMSPEEFEKYSILILKQQMKEMANCRFEHNKIIKVSDGNYQIDGYIEFNLMGVTYKTLVECKHYKSSIEREKVQILYDKLRACGAQKGILISSSNFQSGAITYATQHGIALVQLTEAGNRYETRTMYNTIVAHHNVPCNGTFPYIGVKQISYKEGITQCSYLSVNNLDLSRFLENLD